MRFEKSAGAVVFWETGDKGQVTRNKREEAGGVSPVSCSVLRKYLLLAHKSMGKEEKIIWDFPKGLIGEGESERGTARREVAEETGLSEFDFVEGFRETLKIFFKYQGDFVSKTVVYFLVQATDGDVKISFEHVGFEWLRFKEAPARLSFKNARGILQKAEDFLNGSPPDPQAKLL